MALPPPFPASRTPSSELQPRRVPSPKSLFPKGKKTLPASKLLSSAPGLHRDPGPGRKSASFNPAQPPRGPWVQADGGCGPDTKDSLLPHPPFTPSIVPEASLVLYWPESHREANEGFTSAGEGILLPCFGPALPAGRTGLGSCPLPPWWRLSPRELFDGCAQAELAEGQGDWKEPSEASGTESTPGHPVSVASPVLSQGGEIVDMP